MSAGIEMRPPKTHKPAAVALLQLGPEVHAALESAARRSGHSKSEFVRLAVQGAIQAQEGYWERLLMQVFCSVPELVEAAADAGLLTKEEAKNIIRPMDNARSRLYRELDRIDGLPSIHWVPVKGAPVRSYEEVMRTRASRDELVRPEIAPLEHLENRFIELAAQRLPKRKKTKAIRQELQRSGSEPLVRAERPNKDTPLV
jgi:hypothetical protein